MSSGSIIFIDPGLPETAPLTRFRSLFSIRDGIYSALERVQLVFPGADRFFFHPAMTYEKLIAESESGHAFQDSSFASEFPRTAGEIEKGARSLAGSGVSHVVYSKGQIFSRLDGIASGIENDLPVFVGANQQNLFSPGEVARIAPLTVGPLERLFLHRTCKLAPGVALNTEEGPIVVDEGAHVTPFSVLSGPLYIGKNARVDHAKVSHSIIGHGCRLGGEIERSILGDFTNKHHEGFVGHSVVGSWVNLGALTTTSDLKNNYGQVRLKLPGGVIETGRIKFGSILADCVKTAIGTMLNTGTVLDAGSSIFGGNPPSYVGPFSFGLSGDRYRLDRFIMDCKTIFARRSLEVPPVLARLAEYTVSLDSTAS